MIYGVLIACPGQAFHTLPAQFPQDATCWLYTANEVVWAKPNPLLASIYSRRRRFGFPNLYGLGIDS